MDYQKGLSGLDYVAILKLAKRAKRHEVGQRVKKPTRSIELLCSHFQAIYTCSEVIGARTSEGQKVYSVNTECPRLTLYHLRDAVTRMPSNKA